MEDKTRNELSATFYSKDWAANEFITVNLGDEKRNKRLIKVEQERSSNINASISETCGSWTNTKGAYRFYENKDIEYKEILRAHKDSVIKRALKEKTILAIQDTTTFCYGNTTQISGLGVLYSEEQFGFLLHSNIAYTTNKIPLGVISQEYIIRPIEEFGKSNTRKERPIEDKESSKWLSSLLVTHEFHLQIPLVEVISVSDRESDIYEYLLKANELKEEIIVRASSDRNIISEQKHLWPYMENCEEAGKVTLKIPIKDTHKVKDVAFSVKYSTVNIIPPNNNRKGEKIRLNAVYLKEITDSKEGLSWMLLTTKKVESLEDAFLIVDYYCQRWSIEVFHKILKSGCRILDRQFKSMENIERFITVDSVCALRIQALTMLGRGDEGKTPCNIIFDDYEWQSLYCFINMVKTPPKQIPALNQMILWIAKLGGFIGRKSDKEPGIEVMWLGMQRFYDISETWKLKT